MCRRPPQFPSCPLASRLIETRDDALRYYAERLAGDHTVTVKGVRLVIRFNPEEIHLFTESTKDKPGCPDGDLVRRLGRSGEVRCFDRVRARRLDDILPTLANAAVIHQAKTPGGRVVLGPAGRDAWRYGVVIGPAGGDIWYVRTAYPVSAKDFAQACRSNRPAPWPPK